MSLRVPALALILSATALARLAPAPIPPGRQHRLTIEGENTLTFLPRSGLPPLKLDYKVQTEYIVDTRLGKDPRPQGDDVPREEVSPKEDRPGEDVPRKKSSPRSG